MEKRPIIRKRPEHTISRKNIDRDAVKVLYRLSRFGYTAHLVGGGVRDLLLGREPKDFDIGTDARPNQIKKLFRNAMLIGRRFRLAHIRFGPKIIETSTFRCDPPSDADPDDPDSNLFRKRDNSFGTPEEDAFRRDFTVNGIFYDIKTFQVIDYVGGLQDLERGLIRSIGDPNIRFREDPVRMLRAVRFASKLDFAIEEETRQAILEQKHELEKASPCRILDEILKLFAYGKAERTFRLLQETGLLEILFPELNIFLEQGDKAELFRNLLSALDTQKDFDPNRMPAFVFALLYYPLFLERLEARRQSNPAPVFLQFARDFLFPYARRMEMPKRIFSRTLMIWFGQQRFERKKKFSKIRFARQESFPEALLLRELMLTTQGADQGELNGWKGLYARVQKEEKKAALSERGNARRRTSRGKRPGRKQRHPRASTGGNTHSI
ncbi:MAG: polynucleotide adenylyltransferase PcnB [Desulfovibrionales bacterium]